MDDAYHVADSTDWLNTPLKELSSLENALHCQICKEFYDTPMITSCNHTFCSRCIRTSLSADGKCPACRAADQANKLRNNWAVQEVVSTFLAARPTALAVARKAQEEAEDAPKRPGKRKRGTAADLDDGDHAASSRRTTRSKSRRTAASQDSQPETIEIEDSNDEGEDIPPEPEVNDGLVECPLACGKRMKEEQVFGHLDKCEDEKKQAARSKSRTPLTGFAISRPLSSQSTRPQDRINELNYSMMKETALTKKMKEQALPAWGSKQLMITRHKEWVNIWNANCDSNHPRSRRELLHDLDVWERTQGGKAPNASGLSNTIMRKDFDGYAYSRRHQDEFSRLIADAKRKKNNPATEPEKVKEVAMLDGTDESPPTRNGDTHSSPYFQAPAGQVSNGKTVPSLRTEESGDPTPYATHPEALDSIRAKVDALNQGKEIIPIMNEGFKPPPPTTSTSTTPSHRRTSSTPQQLDPASVMNRMTTAGTPSESPGPAIANLSRHSSRDEHYTHQHTGSPCELPSHLHNDSSDPNPPRKVPMFTVPQHGFDDMDGAAEGH
ncbi:Postreplication repair E3 ubiquitin-protein ligase rad18 [Fulvia fulva]|uniref:Postreplication repair E3 ubiquitin-protein ligase RAD18 n=1 Tax=Passalora fulva TaxID=5499 RepID=A0A9Q8USM6_PASFU|nr:Postreplication repair E3 ubiquitin-protein ligase rad18 [Fulvia fulva]KAK4618087.1 Postreplication repair E3 ubiquitin-protein ligase rad18 [Fulvia fulva]KAK4619059.1 Postreplication repair E3 ubiquitin-protein ligase rad18 [Fulvia fulva]UJO20994.1 Postreplication repair E3 ubiquitin-protein ligase rad18 [Fulvia fulva]WPV17799.1 Postreplication repair E3 ubiquitin-protein ligase rad18 [Fulvia fulva]WPV32891.1 Postreplication repair E3 ubiquitin-protein ligase rad18 [Fulvia fulva]